MVRRADPLRNHPDEVVGLGTAGRWRAVRRRSAEVTAGWTKQDAVVDLLLSGEVTRLVTRQV